MATKREVFATNLRKAVEASYMNQSQLAAKCEVSRGTFSDWVSGSVYPRPERMQKLCQALGVTEYDLTTDFESGNAKEYLNREVAEIAKELYENPDARALYSAITKLSKENKEAMRQLVLGLSEK